MILMTPDLVARLKKFARAHGGEVHILERSTRGRSPWTACYYKPAKDKPHTASAIEPHLDDTEASIEARWKQMLKIVDDNIKAKKKDS